MKKESASIAVKYAIFAVIAIMVNMLTQKLIFMLNEQLNMLLGKTWIIYFAMAAGTLTGLAVKYILDKKYIFYYEVETKAEDLAKFGMYTFMGVFTTIIFWASELFSYFVFESEHAQYIGGTIGLTIGYIIKYLLDKKFVFIPKSLPEKNPG